MHSNLAKFLSLVRKFKSDRRGQVAIIFAISSVALSTAIGAGLDLSRAYVSREQISNVATLTCQYAARPEVTTLAYNGSNSTATYTAAVNAFAANAVSNQNFKQTQTHSVSFNYVQGGTSSVTATASVPTAFMLILGVSAIPVSVTVNCSTAQTTQSSGGAFTESFENSACSGICYAWYSTTGALGTTASPVNTFTGKVAYVGSTNTQWSAMGYCVEIDTVGQIKSTVPDGTHSAELDCDNGSGSAGNSSISTKTYLSVGAYELRYNYASRIPYPNYDPTYICGSTASDVSWANDTLAFVEPFFQSNYGARTNQINVYMDADQSGAPPTHTTIDGTQTLAGSNLIDMCVESQNWIQRSVKITVTTAGYYWISFAADGKSDSYGGQIDNIQLCQTSCSGTVQDNFPPTWLTSTNLFEDTFESPSQGSGNNFSSTTLNASYGTSGSSSGWPGQFQSGWNTAPYNNINYYYGKGYSGSTFAYQGNQSIQLDTYTGTSTGGNKTIARYFYLDPGYYAVTYDYVANETFSSLTSQYCIADPTAPFPQYAYTGNLSGHNRYSNATGSFGNDSNSLAVFMSHSQMASYPNGGGALNSTTTYTNPDGSTTTTPTVAPDALNINTYTGSQVNPLLDYCYYSSTWLPRTTYIKITKPGQYWLTFAAKGTSDYIGAGLDDVKVTAWGSPYGTAPSFSITVPTPSASPGSTISFTGFSITADPFKP